MAKNKFKTYSTKIRSQVQFERIYGLKVSKSVLSRFKKGSYNVETLAKNLFKHNEKYLSQLKIEKSNITAFKTQLGANYSPENLLRVLEGRLGSARYKYDKTFQIRQYARKAIQESMSEDEIAALKGTINETELDLNSFHYNDVNKRLEKVTNNGTIWIKVETSLVTQDDPYPSQIISYGIE